MKNKIVAIIVVLTVLAGIIGLTGCSGGSGTSLKIDTPAPEFKLNDLKGQSVSLTSYKGKTVLINFWATSCSSCVEEMPYLQSFYNDWSGKGVVVLLINAGEDTDTVKTFIEKYKYTFPVLLDRSFEVSDRYNVQYVPNSFIVDKQGTLKLNVIGAFKNQAAIEKQLTGLLP